MRNGLLIALAFVVAGFTACKHGGGNDRKITIAYVNWAEGIALTQLAKNLLEKKGYTVTLKNADVAPVFAAVAGGDADVFMDTWMPATHKDYMDNFGSKVTILNTNFDGAKTGLVVPDYVNINSIEELNAAKKHFGGKIIGIDAGAGIMSKTQDAIKTYHLDLQLQSSSEAAMMATLKKCIDEMQPIVITGWAPHWMFARYKLHFLEDPLNTFGSEEKILTIANNEFSVRDTVAVNFFRKFQLNSQQLGSLMGSLADADGKEDAVIERWTWENAEWIKNMAQD
ncbi:glycine betaine ABC transporter substrate-binding protein [Chitinophaga vietnamensis]|uniref:glycine betaine ABC transporter substrate-binding protein n=1 Tax=Chitinophaga vietnamensis TaxID=2593957 RepID=UPI001177DE91|nr:glycine betaine ABC transporter substrate-binding protein [Chitinophaga vietnamensis]